MSDDQYARTGRLMFLFVWIIFFIGMFLFFYYYDKPENTIFVASRTEYVLSADNEGHYWIKGKINEYPVEFLVDTGATLVAIPQGLAKDLKITGRYPVTIETANGKVTGFLTRLQHLSFGEFHLQNVKAVIIPENDDNTVLLGMNVLSQFHMIQQGKQLILKRQ
ncbi:TPA: retroviral-like aspartic protease family protein [Legionella pneumophila]|uniref:retropepsin-like aspartic protease family protein n=1 Tax=Legionella pneumophila TaxID=446 RepID=UPI0007709C94|nr:retropepsin-like aspartic protease [Legionella pneumophila]AMQ28270.1 aspartyl protease [Legionella pneumophila subsp. pneumophila]MBN5930221.1 retroviral-like aspartic protease family protein [Legionella pneumophila]PQM71462.1 TIGR02281 family clan AA aspartic protease [Legionella pneumophila]QIB24756.1 TIGR02281 family clan AA aspartic protease [Legionella pneumophila]TIG64012.1 TIGR02281 family clan AA aspartic protease [Legionella pneumophila]